MSVPFELKGKTTLAKYNIKNPIVNNVNANALLSNTQKREVGIL